MVSLILISIFFISLLALTMVMLPFATGLVLAVPFIFLYLLMIASILWLFDINVFLGLVALIFYCYLAHLFQRRCKATS
ncbi:hypothetical protein [Gallibacterium sp. AGMB14963]|uniref:hypothetical protein n=1 Tax=Gallibacterium faecale TaxID=3019086 RepID=UPI0022F1C3AB|nr:hypothetical protein [Gallibacterium sp. AGMB14963]